MSSPQQSLLTRSETSSLGEDLDALLVGDGEYEDEGAALSASASASPTGSGEAPAATPRRSSLAAELASLAHGLSGELVRHRDAFMRVVQFPLDTSDEAAHDGELPASSLHARRLRRHTMGGTEVLKAVRAAGEQAELAMAEKGEGEGDESAGGTALGPAPALAPAAAHVPFFSPVNDALRNQSFFLKAAFEMIRSKHEWETQVLEGLRVKFPGLPASNEAIMFGELKKCHPQTHHHVRTKYVVVSPGLLSYVSAGALPSASGGSEEPPEPTETMHRVGSPLVLFGKTALLLGAKDRHAGIKTVRLWPGTRCRAVNKKAGRYHFQVLETAPRAPAAEPTSPTAGSPVSPRPEGFGSDDKEATAAETAAAAAAALPSAAPQAPPIYYKGALFVAQSEEERVRWMRVIEDAAELGASQDESGGVLGHGHAPGHGHGPPLLPELQDIHERVQACADASSYLAALGKVFALPGLERLCQPAQPVELASPRSLGSANSAANAASSRRWRRGTRTSVMHGAHKVDVPMEWAHGKMRLPRGGLGEDNSTEQLFRDMQRDSIVINGRLYSGWSEEVEQTQQPAGIKGTSSMSSTAGGAGGAGARHRSNSASGGFAGPGLCSIVCGLAREIQAASQDVPLTEAEALALGHQVLMSCNRTQSGGNTLDVVTTLLGRDDLAIVAHDSENVPPLKVIVYRLEYPGRAGAQHAQHALHAQAASPLAHATPAAASPSTRGAPAAAAAATAAAASADGYHAPVAVVPELEVGSDSDESHGAQPSPVPGSAARHRKSMSDGDSVDFESLKHAHEASLLGGVATDGSSGGHKGGLVAAAAVAAAGASATATGAMAAADVVKDSKDAKDEEKGPPAAVVSSLRLIQGEILKLAWPRRRASEPFKQHELNKLAAMAAAAQPHQPQQSHQQQQQQHAALLAEFQVRDPGPRVEVQVTMHYKICNPDCDSSQGVWARVTATFKRTFALVGQRKTVALGQGKVSLSLSAFMPTTVVASLD
jgi:hypothetical protein